MDCSSPGSSAHGISQARILEWVAICSSRGSSWARGRTCVSCIGRWILYHWATREAQWIACLPSKYHSWTCNLLSEAVFTWNINSFIKHFEDPAKITNDLSVSTFFFPEKCKAIGNSTSSLTTVCLCISFSENDFMEPLLKQEFSSLWRTSRSFGYLAGKESGTELSVSVLQCSFILILESQLLTPFLLFLPLCFILPDT